jgi:hypothetical protein
MDEEMKAAEAVVAAPSDEKRFEIKKWNAVALWSWGACLRSRHSARKQRRND